MTDEKINTWDYDPKALLLSSRKVKGIFHKSEVDKDGEFITPDAIRKSIPDYMHLPALHDFHKERPVGLATKVWELDGGRFGFEGVIKATSDCDDVWDKIQKGNYDHVSIFGKREHGNSNCSLPAPLRTGPCITSGVRLDSISVCDDNARNDSTSLEVRKGMKMVFDAETLIKAETATSSNLMHTSTDYAGKKKQEAMSEFLKKPKEEKKCSCSGGKDVISKPKKYRVVEKSCTQEQRDQFKKDSNTGTKPTRRKDAPPVVDQYERDELGKGSVKDNRSGRGDIRDKERNLRGFKSQATSPEDAIETSIWTGLHDGKRRAYTHEGRGSSRSPVNESIHQRNKKMTKGDDGDEMTEDSMEKGTKIQGDYSGGETEKRGEYGASHGAGHKVKVRSHETVGETGENPHKREPRGRYDRGAVEFAPKTHAKPTRASGKKGTAPGPSYAEKQGRPLDTPIPERKRGSCPNCENRKTNPTPSGRREGFCGAGGGQTNKMQRNCEHFKPVKKSESKDDWQKEAFDKLENEDPGKAAEYKLHEQGGEKGKRQYFKKSEDTNDMTEEEVEKSVRSKTKSKKPISEFALKHREKQERREEHEQMLLTANRSQNDEGPDVSEYEKAGQAVTESGDDDDQYDEEDDSSKKKVKHTDKEGNWNKSKDPNGDVKMSKAQDKGKPEADEDDSEEDEEEAEDESDEEVEVKAQTRAGRMVTRHNRHNKGQKVSKQEAQDGLDHENRKLDNKEQRLRKGDTMVEEETKEENVQEYVTKAMVPIEEVDTIIKARTDEISKAYVAQIDELKKAHADLVTKVEKMEQETIRKGGQIVVIPQLLDPENKGLLSNADALARMQAGRT
jgi:hypothetical protein